MLNKKGVAFSQIMAVIGAVLISVGIAWLLAQNWHSIPSPFKIFILLSLTFAVYVGGILLQEKEYPKTAHALFVLGALLYTLSIFLIAQIFSTSSNLQNYAWLFLLAWVGVAISAYLFGSYVSLFIALIEFLVWLGIQFAALMNLMKPDSGFSFVFIALLILIAGIFFYGLNLLHRSYQHRFARLFQWWTAFYFLVFTYVLTFQVIIPNVWQKMGGNIGLSPPIIFLIAFGALSLLIFLGGALSFKDNLSSKEILIVIGIIILLISLLLFTNLSSDVVGRCSPKECYNLPDETSCEKSEKTLQCEWSADKWNPDGDLRCMAKNCGSKNESDCSINDNCRWKAEWGCTDKCSLIYEELTPIEKENKALCENREGCSWATSTWGNKECLEKDSPKIICSAYHNQHDNCLSHKVCSWESGSPAGGWFGGKRTIELPSIILFTWIVINIFFILLILAVIGYGSQENFPALINLGILFFAVDIISRYIGFVMDLWGYNILPFIFITGGILLIGGGWLIERWRRSLVNEIRGTSR